MSCFGYCLLFFFVGFIISVIKIVLNTSSFLLLDKKKKRFMHNIARCISTHILENN